MNGSGCSCGSSSQGRCPCQTFKYPLAIFNPPGQSAIAYRVADYLSMRYALLLARDGELELANWRPGAQGDLAVQLVEWWALIGDILTFYSERFANESYLSTAVQPASVLGLVRILGYRPRPGIGAVGTLAATMSGSKSFTLPTGFQAQSKPGPGQQPQIFELSTDTSVQVPDVVPAALPDGGNFIGVDARSVLLQGVVNSAKAGDQLLLLETGWIGAANDNNWSVMTVNGVSPEKSPAGQTNTRITFTQPPGFPSTVKSRLLRSTQSAHVWQYAAAKGDVFNISAVDLEALTRNIHVSDPVLFDFFNPATTPALQLVSVTQYSEAVWYANPPGQDPTKPPTGGSPSDIPIPIPHSHLAFQPQLQHVTDDAITRATTLLLYNWKDVGTVIATPSATLDTSQSPIALSLAAPLPASAFPISDREVLISDGTGNGVIASANASAATPSQISLAGFDDSSLQLKAPFSVLFNLLSVTRGQTVSREILGTGDATIAAGQEFVLQKSPLTYLGGGSSGSGYTSSLRLWVDSVEWSEVPSFYKQPATSRIFVTREDSENKTHVQFGDGVNGARLPSGAQVVATYRYGSGASAPPAGTLSVILQSRPGLKSILNPVAVGGGADPDPPGQIKTYAPQSVLTLGRAISARDYEAIAALAPGVTRARAYFAWDSGEQKALIKIYVGDDQNAVDSAKTALAGVRDLNRPLSLLRAQPLSFGIRLVLVIDPAYDPTVVVNAATAALVDPDQGLFGSRVIRIGQTIFASQIYRACLNVAGALAVNQLKVSGISATGSDFQLVPGEGNFLQLSNAQPNIVPEVAPNAA